VVLLVALDITGLYFRFWLPAIACLVLFFGSVLSERWSASAVAWSAVLLLVAACTLQARAERGRFASDLRMAMGQTSRDQEYRDQPLWNTWTYLNGQTPADAHVLMAAFYTSFGASSGGAFWVRRACYSTDSHLQGFIRLSDWPAFLASIRSAAIDFVVISDTQFAAGRHGFVFTAGANEYPFCQRLVREYGTRVSQFEHIQVYKLRPVASLPAATLQ
jgi:hypothetical protein